MSERLSAKKRKGFRKGIIKEIEKESISNSTTCHSDLARTCSQIIKGVALGSL